MDLQTLIHYLEVGTGMRLFSRTMRIALVVVGVLLLLIIYDFRAFRNMSTQEAMDSAQLARNLAEGKGYTTLFVRPFSMFLIKERTRAVQGTNELSFTADPARLKGMHPDIANPPVYPLLLAGLMKALPFNFAIPSKPKPFWSFAGRFWRYQPDFLIALFNQFLLVVVVLSVFFLARQLFDSKIAWISALLMLGTELFWRFSVSGLSTVLLLLIFTGLVWSLALLERETRQPKFKKFAAYLLACLAGIIVAIGGLTRYSFVCLIFPVLMFVLLFTGRQRWTLALITFLTFSTVLAPWLVRNYSISGAPFGTSTYAILETSYAFPEDRLPRSIDSNLAPGALAAHNVAIGVYHAFWQKLVVYGRLVVGSDLPKLGGTWVSAFFLVGLMLPFKNPSVTRLRYFLLACILVLSITQALGRTELSEDSPDINSENLLVLVAPLVLVYGVSLFLVLLEQLTLPFFELRYVVIGAFGSVVCLPLLLALAPPRNIPVVYPPYYPPIIQTSIGWTTEEELAMSDIPWAVAWYGQTQCAWLTLNSYSDFFVLNDYHKPVSALFLTPRTIDKWSRTIGWSSIFLQSVTHLPSDPNKYPVHLNLTVLPPNGSPAAFPLTYLQPGWPYQLLLTFRQHWPKAL